MKVKFWGVRGSIPAPPTSKQFKKKLLRILEKANDSDLSTADRREEFLNSLHYTDSQLIGGNTSCLEVSADGQLFIFDMGSGIRDLGRAILQTPPAFETINIFISHTHWDHLQGFPFFIPAYRPDYTLNFYSPHGDFKAKLEGQQNFTYFPVALEYMLSQKNFINYPPESEVKLGNVSIKNIELHHPGKCYGYKLEHKGKSIVYATDSEYNNITTKRFNKYIEFYQGAELLIFDAQYSFDQEIQKVDWGHSSALVGIDLAVQAGIKNLALFHHDPENDDYEVEKLLKVADDYKHRNYADYSLNVFIAREGLELVF